MISRTTLRPAAASAASGLVALCAALALTAAPASASAAPAAGVTASEVVAHPLGRFTVNHYNGLKIAPDRVENLAVVDSAELPTLQTRATVDADGSGTVSPPERSAYGAARCGELAAAQRLTVNGTAAAWRVASSAFAYEPGEGGLETSRLTCSLAATVAAPRAVEFEDGFLPDRLGWREITAVAGGGVRLAEASVPGTSVSEELRKYPDDLLTSPLDQRTARLTLTPGTGPETGNAAGDGFGGDAGTGTGAGTESAPAVSPDLRGTVRRRPRPARPRVHRPGRLRLADGPPRPARGGHRRAPGRRARAHPGARQDHHGRLPGRTARPPRDALVVGATVTVTHTLGVLVVGLLLSAFSFLTGESVLGWLGVASGLLITAVGARLLQTAWRAYRTGEAPVTATATDTGTGTSATDISVMVTDTDMVTDRDMSTARLMTVGVPLTAPPTATGTRPGRTAGWRSWRRTARRPPGNRTTRRPHRSPAGTTPRPPPRGRGAGWWAWGSPAAWFRAPRRSSSCSARSRSGGPGSGSRSSSPTAWAWRPPSRPPVCSWSNSRDGSTGSGVGHGLAARASALAPVGTALVVVLLGLGLAVRGLTGAA
nr:hypothetical protein GCM10020093_098810 [Planobispora longispora]